VEEGVVGKQKNTWRVVRYQGYIFLVSPSGSASREFDLDEAEKIAKELNAAREVEALVREGKV
jgi:hypothetical protein